MLKDNYIDRYEYEKDLINSILECFKAKNGERILSAIILTGSFGRGEPTFVKDKDSNWILKSDVEIACVYKRKKRKAEELIYSIAKEFKEDLNMMPISERRIKNVFNFNGTLVVPRYKTLFTFDLFNGSRTIWGIDYIGKHHIEINDCDPYEAKRLVANRIGELIYLSGQCNSDNSYLRKQWKGKLMLAIAGGWLISEKKYASAYHNQYEIIKKEKNRLSDIFGGDFYYDYQKTFEFLRDAGDCFEVTDESLRYYVKMIDNYFHLKKINKPKVNSVSRLVKYYLKYAMTNRKFDIWGFEDNILQSLISQFVNMDKNLIYTAEVWHKVLY